MGELFAEKMLNEKIIHQSCKRLLTNPDEDTIECLCKLMVTVGKLLDRPQPSNVKLVYAASSTGHLRVRTAGREEAKDLMDPYFRHLLQSVSSFDSWLYTCAGTDV